ncbi:MAG TPA: phosphoenolpyruvate--protein phosphotransferase [Candidatus Aminicenantes bacterium]|nr:phosphoenolpyruvate--protein phosphotransferase [Candidatus Aminicenantes bacterium]HRY64348.1 phosphoenolpyruvate--protein phosphotransferase [Candidatus Aminicenantes bacterium]HRZ71261.1 phosphoenolpyruvate--protein phosphotransferase [Candidatus Aminicenantes bacterium]
MDITRLRGIGVSPGIAIGEILLPKRVVFTSRKEIIADDQVPAELERLQQALDRTRDELVRIRDGIREKAGPDSSLIFEAHLLILEDPALVSGLEAVIRDEKARAEWALSKANARFEQLFESLTDDYFRQRKSDVSDVLKRVYRNLENNREKEKAPQKPHILVAHELLPSEAALRLSKELTLGVALDMGGQTSHTAILARSLGIPAVLGLRDITRNVTEGELAIVDGTDGEVIIDPPPAVRREFQAKKDKYENYSRELQKTARLKAETLDRVRFVPQANIELPEEVALSLSMGAEGVGLFRSEFIYLRRESLPTEEDHFEIYAGLARGAHPYPVTIRTLDIGGEKSLPRLNIEKEPNPALGLRAVRFSLQNRDLFRIQLRAILRASTGGNVRVLVPMVTEIDEILEVKQIFADVQREMRRKGEAFDEKIPLGVMIEVPAAAALAEAMLREVDFVSIGTNDLIQYYLAVDRANESVSYLYKPFHPAVIRLIRSVIQAARHAGKDVVVCGEMAADTPSAVVLLGFGLRTFSMNPIFIPRVKKALRSIECRTAEKIAEETLKLRSAQEIEEYVTEEILLRHPQVFLTGQPLDASKK